jgi:outer membrane protein
MVLKYYFTDRFEPAIVSAMIRNRFMRPLLAAGVLAGSAWMACGQTSLTNNIPAWTNRSLSVAEAIDLALRQNGSILRGKSDLEAQYGVVVQTRAVALPTLSANANTLRTTEIQQFPSFSPLSTNSAGSASPAGGFSIENDSWTANVQLTQTIYGGGRLLAGVRSARLARDQAVLNFQTVVQDSVLQVQVAYYDVLQAAEQVQVHEASVNLLAKQLDDQKHRYDAGTVPRFNVLQADVELANERPLLIQARNALRNSRNLLVNLLGYQVPAGTSQEIPMDLTDHLDDAAYSMELPVAVEKALRNRSELEALRKTARLRSEDVINQEAGYKPTVQLFAGYGTESSSIDSDLGWEVHGYTVGAQASWNIFDGLLTHGRVEQAKAMETGARVDLDNETRSIELEVRTDYSDFIEARETLESQKTVQEEAEEALRLAIARADAGTGTQLDVLSAQTSLTRARSTQVQALHDYDVARARLERAIGTNIYGPATGAK